ncbi:MAG: phosphatidylinositol-specific phospholipase C/glycerophosphodiester phosphodiesterase family protein [Capsulimonadales bacterium]|nr:phosphatidylinositol-specific phospholipase C/glycerophosphodiester phosphodiesterase family protein [Capsulimonadales bacterium]
MLTRRSFFPLLCAAVFALTPISAYAEEPSALPNAHAHNDYEHTRPLLDALDQGFCSVEADIHLVDGELLVAHDRNQVKPGRTLRALYLDPLRARARRNGGRIYQDAPGFFLLIDVKSEAKSTYAALRKVLEQYSDILTEFRSDGVRRKAVTVVVSGGRDIETMKAEKRRFGGIDGRLGDLDSGFPPSVFPWISDSWPGSFRWNGEGEFPEEERKRLVEIVRKAHQRGYLVRFWGAPNTEAIWRVQREAGVDLLNADDLPGMRRFLLESPAKRP